MFGSKPNEAVKATKTNEMTETTQKENEWEWMNNAFNDSLDKEDYENNSSNFMTDVLASLGLSDENNW